MAKYHAHLSAQYRYEHCDSRRSLGCRVSRPRLPVLAACPRHCWDLCGRSVRALRHFSLK